MADRDRAESSAAAQLRSGDAHFIAGRYTDALARYDAALALDPQCAAAHAHRAEALLRLDRTREALAAFERAISLQPGDTAAHYNRGTILLDLGRHGEALSSFERALALDRDDPDTLANRGVALAALGRQAEALASYDRALALRPEDAITHFNRGNALAALGEPLAAVASYDRALALDGRNVEILYNRANALAEANRLDLALAGYDRVLAIAPDRADAHNNRGNVLLRLKRPGEARDAYDRALAAHPGHRDALGNRAMALWEARRYADAARAFEALLAVAPDFDYARGTLLRCRLRLCDWGDLATRVPEVEAAVARGERAAVPLDFIALSDSAAAQLACARVYADDLYPAAAPRPAAAREPRGRIRVAYLSADFHEHATAYLAARLFELHDRERFEVHGVSFGPETGDAMRARLRRAFDRFDDVRASSDAEVAQALRARGIDIAVDLKGYTADCRAGILAQRAAPVQVSFLGYPGTMGAGFIDYLVADARVIPAGRDVHYTEKVVRLPDCFQVNDATRPIAERTPTRAEAGLPGEGFVFCCFNNGWKITPAFFGVWMRLLEAVPGSVLWLLGDNDDAVANLRREAQGRGIAPARLVFAPRIAAADHLARHRLADLFLDTLPCNAHTTASDALWAGLPVLTCTGEAFAARVASSLLHAAGLPELVTTSVADYEALALTLAREPLRLQALRDRIAANRDSCALFDTARFCRNLEAAYAEMNERQRRGEGPAGFVVAPLA